MRTQTPAPSPNSLPSRTATAGDTGLSLGQEVLAGNTEQRRDFRLGPAGRRDHFAQQVTRMGRSPVWVVLPLLAHFRHEMHVR